MNVVKIADAKARLSGLIALAEAGETIRIARRSVAEVELRGLRKPRKPIDIAALKALTDAMPISDEVVTAMREESRY